jgi:hypothetical protein
MLIPFGLLRDELRLHEIAPGWTTHPDVSRGGQDDASAQHGRADRRGVGSSDPGGLLERARGVGAGQRRDPVSAERSSGGGGGGAH